MEVPVDGTLTMEQLEEIITDYFGRRSVGVVVGSVRISRGSTPDRPGERAEQDTVKFRSYLKIDDHSQR